MCTIFPWQFGNCAYTTESAERGRNTRFDQIGAFGLTPYNYRVFASSPLSAFLFGVINKPLVPFFRFPNPVSWFCTILLRYSARFFASGYHLLHSGEPPYLDRERLFSPLSCLREEETFEFFGFLGRTLWIFVSAAVGFLLQSAMCFSIR